MEKISFFRIFESYILGNSLFKTKKGLYKSMNTNLAKIKRKAYQTHTLKMSKIYSRAISIE